MMSTFLESSEIRLRRPRTIANLLIYASVALGVVLLARLYSIVPPWLFFSVLVGWIGYLVVGIAVTLQVSAAYPVSVALAFLTLAISLPQPEHYSFGASVASGIFLAGSILQVGVILSVARYLLLKNRR